MENPGICDESIIKMENPLIECGNISDELILKNEKAVARKWETYNRYTLWLIFY